MSFSREEIVDDLISTEGWFILLNEEQAAKQNFPSRSVAAAVAGGSPHAQRQSKRAH